jgi:predicted acetyltransferase
MITSTTPLRLRPLRAGDEAEFRRAHEIMAKEGFPFGLLFDPAAPWDSYLAKLADHRCGVGLPDGWVPGTILVAVVDGTIVGRVSVRHRLNDFLEREAGHIGYGVLPDHRRRGYATEILRQGLVIARSLGIGRVLVCCDDDNAASAAVIERCGGRLHSVIIDSDGIPTRRYWIS